MELEWLKLLALALAPVVFLFTLVYVSDVYEREPIKYLIITFFLGTLLAIPVMYIGEFLVNTTGISAYKASTLDLFIYTFFFVATTEETLKYLVLRWYNYRHEEFDEPYDGIMYGVAVSLGFAAIENVLYVFQAHGDSVEIALLRMFTAVPAHAIFGVIMGFFVGKAKFLQSKGNAWLYRMAGLVSAIIFHGIYDFFLFQESEYLIRLAFVSLIVGFGLAVAAMIIHATISPHKKSDKPDKPQSWT